MPMAGGAAERFPLDEEPAGMDDHAPSPRVVSQAQSAPAPMPPAPMAPAPMAPAPPAPMAHAPAAPTPPRGAQAALSAVVSHAARSFNPYEVTAPAGEGDPRRDAARRAVEGALEAAAKSGASFDRDAIGHAALEELVGLGALGALIADTSAHAVVVAGADAVAVDRGQGLAPADACFSSSEALSVIVGRLVTMGGGYFDRGKPAHEGSLPAGVHFTALLPPVAVGGPIVELRRTQRASLGGEQLVSRGALSNEMLDVLRRASRGRRTVVVVGPSDAGVAQLVSAVASLASGERLLAIEEVPRLELDAAVRLTAAPGATLEDVIRQGGRMHADRVVIDGVRGKETLAALLTAASRSGSVVGVHSASGGDALEHLGALARLGGATSEALASLLPSVVHVIVRMGRGGDGRARVESLAEVRRGGSGAQLVELFGANFAPTGQSPSF
ncbi:MAG: ATPase, T2SS/T4P/T4SS family [Sandaracinaceae bacterium]|nr:ATPase, T2SS/T4P/T4SS family [Sandaracinaceae bacterium]